MNANFRFLTRRTEFDRAVNALDEALQLLQSSGGDEKLRKALRDSLIQRFEFCYELAWKCLKLWLEDKGVDARNPKDVLRESAGQGFLHDVAGWTAVHENRNLTSHTYDEAQAEKVAAFVVETGAALFWSLRATLAARDST
jgi:nucleotidyltransferase substrate binding protein (TIGR01987 family)